MKSLEIILTADGSHSIRVPELNENYHSKFGAITESEHIFINAGLLSVAENITTINILEVGFGTGLNALLTYYAAIKKNLYINYTAIELYPLEWSLAKTLNYTTIINNSNADKIFQKLHLAEWDKKISVSDKFKIEKIHQNLTDYIPQRRSFDLIYFDAFGPDVQPELWSEQIFEKLAISLKPGGRLVTYSTKGDVKRALKKNNFTIEKLPGPPGKREIIRATLSTVTGMVDDLLIY